MTARHYRMFRYREAVFRIGSDRFDAVTAAVVRERHVLEAYIDRHPGFREALEPVGVAADAPLSVRRMARAAQRTGVGPMAAVAGTMAQLAAEAALRAGAEEAIVENGGDLFVHAATEVVVGLHAGDAALKSRLAFRVTADRMPVAVCSSSGRMGHSMSMGRCDLATVVARDAALADAAATLTANLVRCADDLDAALEQVGAIDGVDGVLICQDDRVGMCGRLPELVSGKCLLT